MTSPEYRSIVVPRHARIAIVGDVEEATEAWILLHGYGMLARGILHWFRAAARPGRVLIAPEALSRFYAESHGVRHVVASWMTREARLDDIADITAYLDRVMSDIVGPRARIEVHGFSQGVPTATRWLAQQAAMIDRLVCWGSNLPGDVDAEALMHRVREGRLHYVIGRKDTRIAPADVHADAERLRGAGIDVQVHEFDGGHRIDDGVLQALEPGA